MRLKIVAILYAVLAALFYAINTPASKLLMENIPVTFMASFLYLGAGVGVGIMYLFAYKKEPADHRLVKSDLPYTIGMIVLDIAAPIFMMLGVKLGTASNASLLGNFEIVATTIIALCFFKEKVGRRLWAAIGLITLSSIILSFEGISSFDLSYGSIFVLLATLCWGLENNCTRKISEKSTYQIVVLKGIFSGLGAFIIALIVGEEIPAFKYILMAMLLGYVAYGLSIFTYIRAQRTLGAAKTSAYYAIAPFVGALLSFIILKEQISGTYITALVIMLAGTVFAVWDTIVKNHKHIHSHTVTHTHDGSTHTHVIEHTHSHDHVIDEHVHGHTHSTKELEKALDSSHKH